MSQDNNSREMHLAKLDGTAALRFADLVSVMRDLDHVLECCSRLVDRLAEDEAERDGVVLEALWSAALVAYSRCFASGKRLGLDDALISALPGDPSGFHQYIRDMRDKRVAHSVNPFEWVMVGAALPPRGSENPRVQGIGTVAFRQLVVDEEGVRSLMRLAGLVRGRVAELAKEAETETWAEARGIAIEELYEGEELQWVIPGPESAGEARS